MTSERKKGGGQPLIGFFPDSIVFSFSPSSSSYFFSSVFPFFVPFPSLMMNRAHDSKIWKKHLFFLCTDSPISEYNCLIDYRRSAKDVVQNNVFFSFEVEGYLLSKGQPIRTSTPGVQRCVHMLLSSLMTSLPKLTIQADKLAVKCI